ncbi:MAG TPA: pilus assembly protein TadG-related protein [Acidimicrobiia bacterium]|nr:pilus assembly protein TadG-related protein [Acidimicrobiia bacterium]
MKEERGAATIWFLGLSLALMMMGALSAELWRLIGERQELSSMADAAAVAAAGAVDLDHYRETGQVRLAPAEAEQRALLVIAGHSGGTDLAAPPLVEVAADGLSVRTWVARSVPAGLIRLLSLGEEGFLVQAGAVAYPSVP